MKRRAFVAATALGVGSAIAATKAQSGPAAAASAPMVPVGAPVPIHFDRAGFAAILAKPYPHRQLITAITFAQAESVPKYLRNSLRAYADPDGFAAGPNGLHCVAVLYGPAIAMVLDDGAWAKYPIGALTGQARTNPLLADASALVAEHGVTFFICNNSLSGIAESMARVIDGGDVTRARVVAIHDDLVTHLIPGSMLVPAGVATINAVQEAHFTYLPSA